MDLIHDNSFPNNWFLIQNLTKLFPSPFLILGGSPPWWGLNLFWHGTERASNECCWCRATSLVNVNECCWCRSICLVNDPYVIRVICLRRPYIVIKASTEHHSSNQASIQHQSTIIWLSSRGTNFVPQDESIIHASGTNPASFRQESSIIQASIQHHSGII